ncbi:hypothetical protein KAF25_004190 [Fusarium avenaceum]|uniref:Glutathione S-transferase n=1 Tax=Fusarium avenaceum TaxID=40199 RepID=A0A9P7KX00_9HYPO|nr:hypothetical protein KAF25_004190 [Fusarium avenaceum]
MEAVERSSRPRFICLAHSPSAQGVFWLLEELQVDYDIKKFERPLDKLVVGLKDTHIQGHSPQLILQDGRVITQMSTCMLYLLLTYDTDEQFHKTDPEYRLREDYLVSLAIADVMARVGTKHLFLILGAQGPFLLRPLINLLGYGLNRAFLDPEVENQLHVMEMELEGRDWFMGGDVPSRADIALKVSTDLIFHPKLAMVEKWPRVKAWRERCEARIAWKRSIEKGDGYNLDWLARLRESRRSWW